MHESLEEQNRKYNRAHRDDFRIDPKRYPSLWRELYQNDETQNPDAKVRTDPVKRAEAKSKPHPTATVRRNQQPNRQQTWNRPRRKSNKAVILVVVLFIALPVLISFVSNYLVRNQMQRQVSNFISDRPNLQGILDAGVLNGSWSEEVSDTDERTPYASHFQEITAAWRYAAEDENGSGFVLFFVNEDNTYCGYLDRYRSVDDDIQYHWMIGETTADGDAYTIRDGADIETIEVERSADDAPLLVYQGATNNPLFEAENPVALEPIAVDERLQETLQLLDEIG